MKRQGSQIFGDVESDASGTGTGTHTSSRRPRRASSAAPVQCYLCQNEIAGPVTKYREKSFDAVCFAALRSRRRLNRGSKTLLAADEDLFQNDPAAWRVELMPFTKSQGRAGAVRNKKAMVTTYELTSKVKEDVRLRDRMLLNKRRFKKHMTREESMSSGEASMEWDEQFAKDPMQDSEGEEVVKVRKPTVLRQASGRRREHITETRDVDDASHNTQGTAAIHKSATHESLTDNEDADNSEDGAPSVSHSATSRRGPQTPRLSAKSLKDHHYYYYYDC